MHNFGTSDAAGPANPSASPDVQGEQIASPEPGVQEHLGDVVAPGMDHDAGVILGDTIAVPETGEDLGDLQAALAALSSDTFAYLDTALDYLTGSSDLFDVPSVDLGDHSGSADT